MGVSRYRYAVSRYRYTSYLRWDRVLFLIVLYGITLPPPCELLGGELAITVERG
jgi:hypothetical protein